LGQTFIRHYRIPHQKNFVFTNPAMVELVKIGKTKQLEAGSRINPKG
jgi:hypothetical protein